MNQKIVCWVGNAPNHRALVSKLSLLYHVRGVVIDTKKKTSPGAGFLSLWNKVIQKIRFGKIDKAWRSLQEHYRQRFPEWPAVQTMYTDSINSAEAYAFTRTLQPDLVVVSGTSLVKEPLLSMQLPIGIINLHTGLSPYVKGGPNCTNWCIAGNHWALIGSTVLWLSAGIDAGNIVASERIDISEERSLPAIHLKVMEHAHDLYVRAIRYLLTARPPYQSIAQQSLGKGNLYLTRMWTSKQKRQLLRNLRSSRNRELPGGILTVPLPA